MKKLFLLFAFVGISVLGYSQDVKVNINNQDATATENCSYRINGICSTEDIGGVDVIIDDFDAVFTNYNSYPVTVLYECVYSDDSYRCSNSYVSDKKTGSIVLGIEGQKRVSLGSNGCSKFWSLKGIIVRKLAQ